MKVLLINPPIPSYFYNREFYCPSSLLYLGAVLQENAHEVRVIDFKTCQRDNDPDDNFYQEKLISIIQQFLPDIIGFGSLFSGNFPDVLKLARVAKTNFPKIFNVIGGIHPTLYAQEILENCDSVDSIVLGEGEKTIIKIIDAMTGKGSFADIDGFAYKSNGKCIVNAKCTYIQDVDSIAFPAYELINLEDYYVDTSKWHNPKGLPINTSLPVISSRSCPNRCSFCSMYQVMGPLWRARSPKNVVDEIEYLYKHYGHCHFSFMDDNFTFNKDRLLVICDEIIRRNLDIQFETPNGISIKTLDQSMLDAMVNAGLTRISLAIESGSDFIRNKIMKKRLSKEKIYEVMAMVRKYRQLYVSAFFIIGMPEETKETLQETYNMIKNIRSDKTIVMNLVPFPGTAVYEQALRDDLLVDVQKDRLYLSDDRYFTNYDQIFLKPYNLKLEEMRQFRVKCIELLKNQQV